MNSMSGDDGEGVGVIAQPGLSGFFTGDRPDQSEIAMIREDAMKSGGRISGGIVQEVCGGEIGRRSGSDACYVEYTTEPEPKMSQNPRHTHLHSPSVPMPTPSTTFPQPLLCRPVYLSNAQKPEPTPDCPTSPPSHSAKHTSIGRT